MKSSKGFTLIEIQIAILILLLIMAVLMGGLKLTAKTKNAAENLSEQTADMRAMSRLFQQQFSNILPLKALESGKSKLIFQGETDELYYVGYLPERVINGGPWLLHTFQKDEQVMLEYRVFDNTQSIRDNLRAEFEEVVLLNDVDELSIEYQTEKGTWKSNWKDTHNMPQRLKIQLIQTDKTWPEIIVPVYSFSATETPFHVLAVK